MKVNPFIIFSIFILGAGTSPFNVMSHFAKQDTVTLGSVRQLLEIKSGSEAIEVQIRIDSIKINKTGRRFISLKGISMAKAPEGVYEIYLSDKKHPVASLTANSSLFVNVVDTYTPNKEEALFQLPGKLNSLFDASMSCCFVYILFRGNILPGNTRSINAGKLNISEVAIVQATGP
jgi:hypothetical protein